ncbi:MAG: hypothetical protein BWX91_02210 [Spirochaetes bacterium ADurb.Bin133]|nr:MAG: hypothetical protein BWX91_02210 [Spirochaetes bacterium ADurb.Bin133]
MRPNNLSSYLTKQVQYNRFSRFNQYFYLSIIWDAAITRDNCRMKIRRICVKNKIDAYDVKVFCQFFGAGKLDAYEAFCS